MDILGKASGFIIFKDKNSAELKVKRLKNDPELMNSILTRVALIHEGVKAKALVQRPYGRDTWHCKLCSYRLQCWKLPMDKRTWGGNPYQASKAQRTRALVNQLAKDASEGTEAIVGHPRKPSRPKGKPMRVK